jgi:methyl-accepting chemotaxis protein
LEPVRPFHSASIDALARKAGDRIESTSRQIRAIGQASSGNAETSGQLLHLAENIKQESKALDQLVETFRLEETA